MLTKVFAAFALVGALVVAFDASVTSIGQSAPTERTAAVQKSCCAEQSSCCVAHEPCCDAAYTYCTRTGQVYEGCCCEIVDGLYRCLVTGQISEECCCIPVE